MHPERKFIYLFLFKYAELHIIFCIAFIKTQLWACFGNAEVDRCTTPRGVLWQFQDSSEHRWFFLPESDKCVIESIAYFLYFATYTYG